MWHFMGTNMTFFHGFTMSIFWIIVIIIILSLVKSNDKKEESAKDILDKRLAKGEITKEEYTQLKKELS